MFEKKYKAAKIIGFSCFITEYVSNFFVVFSKRKAYGWDHSQASQGPDSACLDYTDNQQIF